MDKHAFDSAYVERLGRGDPQTENHFYAYFGELVRIKARARRLTPAHAEDVRQETFLRVLRTLRSPEGLRSAGALGAFVNSVCNNVLREGFRDQKKHAPPRDEPEPLPDPVTPSAEAQLIGEETKRAVQRVVDGLPAKDRELLRALFLEEREKAEVCQRLGVTRDYLRVLLHRAKNQFRTLYLRTETTGAVAAPGDDRRAIGGSAAC